MDQIIADINKRVERKMMLESFKDLDETPPTLLDLSIESTKVLDKTSSVSDLSVSLRRKNYRQTISMPDDMLDPVEFACSTVDKTDLLRMSNISGTLQTPLIKRPPSRNYLESFDQRHLSKSDSVSFDESLYKRNFEKFIEEADAYVSLKRRPLKDQHLYKPLDTNMYAKKLKILKEQRKKLEKIISEASISSRTGLVVNLPKDDPELYELVRLQMARIERRIEDILNETLLTESDIDAALERIDRTVDSFEKAVDERIKKSFKASTPNGDSIGFDKVEPREMEDSSFLHLSSIDGIKVGNEANDIEDVSCIPFIDIPESDYAHDYIQNFSNLTLVESRIPSVAINESEDQNCSRSCDTSKISFTDILKDSPVTAESRRFSDDVPSRMPLLVPDGVKQSISLNRIYQEGSPEEKDRLIDYLIVQNLMMHNGEPKNHPTKRPAEKQILDDVSQITLVDASMQSIFVSESLEHNIKNIQVPIIDSTSNNQKERVQRSNLLEDVSQITLVDCTFNDNVNN